MSDARVLRDALSQIADDAEAVAADPAEVREAVLAQSRTQVVTRSPKSASCEGCGSFREARELVETRSFTRQDQLAAAMHIQVLALEAAIPLRILHDAVAQTDETQVAAANRICTSAR